MAVREVIYFLLWAQPATVRCARLESLLSRPLNPLPNTTTPTGRKRRGPTRLVMPVDQAWQRLKKTPTRLAVAKGECLDTSEAEVESEQRPKNKDKTKTSRLALPVACSTSIPPGSLRYARRETARRTLHARVHDEAKYNEEEKTVRSDIYAELYLWNKNVDEMIRLFECATDAGIWTLHKATRHAARLELLRAKLNADFSELMVLRERANVSRLARKTYIR